MNKQQKIDKIYEVIADKTLSFGCRVSIQKTSSCTFTSHVVCTTETKIYMNGGGYRKSTPSIFNKGKVKKVIGHPVMIGDVLDWIVKKYDLLFINNPNATYGAVDLRISNMMISWKEKRKPIDDQNDECIDYVYFLISDDNENPV